MRVKKISVRWLHEHQACDKEAIDMFKKQRQTNPIKLIEKLIKKRKFPEQLENIVFPACLIQCSYGQDYGKGECVNLCSHKFDRQGNPIAINNKG